MIDWDFVSTWLAYLYYPVAVLAIALGARGGRCPLNWHNDGVRRDGVFECFPRPIGDDHRDARGILVDDSFQPPGRVVGRICCDASETPVVVSSSLVGCRHIEDFSK